MELSDDPHLFALHLEAWQTARAVVSERGGFEGDLDTLTRKLIRRKSTKRFPESEATSALEVAVVVMQEFEMYRRKNIGMTAPKTERRYEVLHDLAKHLSAKFSGAPDIYFLFACQQIERGWGR